MNHSKKGAKHAWFLSLCIRNFRWTESCILKKCRSRQSPSANTTAEDIRPQRGEGSVGSLYLVPYQAYQAYQICWSIRGKIRINTINHSHIRFESFPSQTLLDPGTRGTLECPQPLRLSGGHCGSSMHEFQSSYVNPWPCFVDVLACSQSK